MSSLLPTTHVDPDDLTQLGYPFVRGHWYKVGACREYERKLSPVRQARPLFSRAVSSGTAPWIVAEAKLREDEVLPLLAFTEHHEVPDEADICVEPFGQDSVVDASIRIGETCSNYQIVTTGMSWPLSDGRRSRHGHDRRNANLAMQDGQAVSGYSAFEKRGEEIAYAAVDRTEEEIVEAFRLGLLVVLPSKFHRSARSAVEINQHSVELLVYCNDIGESEAIFLGAFENALLVVLDEVGECPFRRTHVFGSLPGACWSF